MSGCELRGITKRYGQVAALEEVSVRVAPGEFCVLLGPSGCGKSTLLRILAGLEEPDAGRVYIGGREVTGLEPRERDVAMVFQSYALYPHLTVFDNMAFALRLRGVGGEEIRRKVEETAHLLAIGHLLARRPAELSGGERQRVAMGRALVREPQLFLFDEPLSNLDARLRLAMRVELAALHQRLGATMVYVTHDQAEAMTLATRIVLLDRGRVSQEGSPRELYERPANTFAAGFVGSPPMNLIEGELARRDAALVFVADGLEVPLPPLPAEVAAKLPAPLTLGVRPQDVRVLPPGERKGAALTGTLEVVEDLGAERYGHVRVGRLRLTVRLEEGHQPGERLALLLPPAKMHLFRGGVRVG